VSTRPTTLAEAWEQRQAESALATHAAPASVQAKRDFMAGALAAVGVLNNGGSQTQLLRECLDYATTIGRAVERA
jgi:hypothetical protein